MSLINKFIINSFEKPHIVVCSSNSQMLFSKDLFDRAKIENDLIPTPKGFGGVCTTAIKFSFTDKERVEEIVRDNNIEVEGIYSLESKFMYDLTAIKRDKLSSELVYILDKISNNFELDRGDIRYLLEIEEEIEYNALIQAADIIRKECVGDRIELRAAIEFSNYCMKNCNYCGVRRDKEIPRYRMTEEEILEEVDKLYNIGIKTVILQSGEDPYYTLDRLISIVKKIKDKYKLGITLSVGERNDNDYVRLREAGVNNYLLKIETANGDLFQQLHPDDDYETRVKQSKLIKDAGIRLGSGGMVGLPGQTIDHLIEDIIFQRDFGVHMIGFGPFLPAKGTPYGDEKPGDLRLTLKVIAIARIVCQHVFLPATTAIASLHPDAQALALMAGANTIMLVSTPQNLRNNYQIYSNKNMVDLSFAIKSVQDAKRKLPKYLNYDYIESQGYCISKDLIE